MTATALELLPERFAMMLKWFFYSRRRRLCETRCAEFAESQLRIKVMVKSLFNG